jgi:hypothetical protein
VKARCPGGATGPCGKVVGVVEAGALGERPVHYFANHRRPGGGNCSVGRGDRVRKRDLIHPCHRCAELPVDPGPFAGTTEERELRPPTPRPVTGKGRLLLCATHRREHTAALKDGRADRQRARRFGVTVARWRELIAAQGGGCACGLPHSGSKKRLAADHDHAREAECVRLGRHPAGSACEHCVRGGLGDQCNRLVVGRFTSAQLRNLADYMDTPTAQRLGWWDADDAPADDDNRQEI